MSQELSLIAESNGILFTYNQLGIFPFTYVPKSYLHPEPGGTRLGISPPPSRFRRLGANSTFLKAQKGLPQVHGQ